MQKDLILIDDKEDDIIAFRGLVRKWNMLEYRVIANDHLLRPTNSTEVERERFICDLVEFVATVRTPATEAIVLDVWFASSDGEVEPLGYLIGRSLRAKCRDIPIILLTVRSEPDRIREALRLNFDGFISKADFRSWREGSKFEAELHRARMKRDSVLAECKEMAGEGAHPKERREEPVILHISDIHHDLKAGALDAYEGMLVPLVRDVREGFPDMGIPRPNVLVVSGDVTHKGSPSGYAAARSFLSKLCEELGIEPTHGRVVIVPGNHDISHDISSIGLSERKGALVANDLYRFRLAPFKEFVEEWYPEGNVYRLSEHETFSIHDSRLDLGLIIVGLNSCERNNHMQPQSAYISHDSLEKAINATKRLVDGNSEGIVGVVVWHHPHLSERGDDPTHNQEIMSRLSRAGFCLALHGHVHRPLAKPLLHDGLVQLGAGTIAGNEAERNPDWPRHYQVVAIDRGHRKLKVFARHTVGNTWHPFKLRSGGKTTFPLKTLVQTS